MSPWTAVITLIFLVSVRIIDPSFVESVRLRYFDTLITQKTQTISQQVHVVNIDDETLKKYGENLIFITQNKKDYDYFINETKLNINC